MTGADDLLGSCDEYFVKSYNYAPDKYEYDKDSILIGVDEFNSEVYIESDEAFRGCMIAKTRTGKTFALRRIIDEMFHSGWSIAILPDAKDEYKSSVDLVQKKFRRNLPKGEKPRSLPIRVFRPLFFKTAGPLPSRNEWVSIDLVDMTKPDFMTLCNYGLLTDKMKLEFDDIWHRMESEDITALDDLRDLCVSQLGYTKLWDKIKFIMDSNLFDSRFAIDPVDIVMDGEIPVLNYNDFDKLDIKDNSLDQVFLGVWLRKLISARKDKKISNLMIINDETARWVPKNGSPSCKDLIMHSIDEHAGFGVSYFFGFQRESSVPEDLIRQCKSIMIPHNTDRKLLEFVLKNNNIIRNAHLDSAIFMEINKTLRAKKFRWLKISDGNYEFVDFFSPTSNHMESRINYR